MKKVTVWRDKVSGKLNHIEDGWVEGEYPKPIKEEFANQKSWESGSWRKEYKYLDAEGKVLDKN